MFKKIIKNKNYFKNLNFIKFNNFKWMSTINIKMNGINIKTDSEDTILTAANNNHVYIPTLCYHPRVPEGFILLN